MNILLTGIPRAGTTLAASLLDGEPDTVCLNEPEWQHPHPSLDAAGFARAIEADFAETHKKLLAAIPVPDRRDAQGNALTNYYGSGTNKNFVMYPLVRENLPADFTLAMKHNGPYLAVLPELIALGSFEMRAVIRHPLPVLRSWRRLNLPISRGEMPNAIAYWPEMKTLTESNLPLLEKQVRMLELMFARIMEYQQQVKLVRYEELRIQDSGFGIQEAEKETAEDTAIIAMLEKYATSVLQYYPL